MPKYIHVGSLCKNVLYFSKGIPQHKTPGNQEKDRVRVSANITLPEDILIELRLSSKAYDGRINQDADRAKAAAAAAAAAAKADAAKTHDDAITAAEAACLCHLST